MSEPQLPLTPRDIAWLKTQRILPPVEVEMASKEDVLLALDGEYLEGQG